MSMLLCKFVFAAVEQAIDSLVAGRVVFFECAWCRGDAVLVLKGVIVSATVVQRRQLDDGHVLAYLVLGKVFFKHYAI